MSGILQTPACSPLAPGRPWGFINTSRSLPERPPRLPRPEPRSCRHPGRCRSRQTPAELLQRPRPGAAAPPLRRQRGASPAEPEGLPAGPEGREPAPERGSPGRPGSSAGRRLPPSPPFGGSAQGAALPPRGLRRVRLGDRCPPSSASPRSPLQPPRCPAGSPHLLRAPLNLLPFPQRLLGSLQPFRIPLSPPPRHYLSTGSPIPSDPTKSPMSPQHPAVSPHPLRCC